MGELLVKIEPRTGNQYTVLRDKGVPKQTRKSVADDAGIKERQRIKKGRQRLTAPEGSGE